MLRNFTHPCEIVKLKFQNLVYSCIVTFVNKIKDHTKIKPSWPHDSQFYWRQKLPNPIYSN